MSRTRLAAAAAALLLATVARSEEPKTEATPPAPSAADPRVEALVKEAVEKAKQDLRDELRTELQGAQAAAQFLGTTSEGPKFQFFELDGYLRARGDLFDNFGLHRGLDSNGQYVWPQVIFNPSGRGTQTSANMRLRLEPTINASEKVRVRAQVDVLDNYVFGSTAIPTSNWTAGVGSVSTPGGTLSSAYIVDRPVVNVKRVWGEVETPFGLLSFGRMPSVWGLGIVSPAADGLDDDLGDSKDRLQFATLPVPTPLGPLTFIPSLTFDTEGSLSPDPRLGAGVGQPFTLDSGSKGRTFGFKVVRLDTDQEMRRKFERGEASVNYGGFYEYSTLPRVNLSWLANGFASGQLGTGTTDQNLNFVPSQTWIDRAEYRHSFDLWYRYRTSRFHLEVEAAGVIGQIGNPGPFAWSVASDGSLQQDLPYTGKAVLLRQFGGAARATYQVAPNKVTLGAEFGVASGDPAPGMGNDPGQLAGTSVPSLPNWTSSGGPLEGPQYGLNGDHSITNFRFNPGYRVDLILWRELLGNVTDAFYFKPTVRWDITNGLAFDGQIVYSQALDPSSTPSATSRTTGNAPLGIELDTKLSYSSDDGVRAWLQYGLLQPLDAFSGAGSLTRAHALRVGVAIQF
jgi:uncharacterized protein (TIGR04551 family)